MRHFVVYPSAKPERGMACAEKWTRAGYEVLIMVDAYKTWATPWAYVINDESETFQGYYKSINKIIEFAFSRGADLITAIGDDMDPPEAGAQIMAERYFSKFPDGFGVMQPCADPQGDLMIVKGFEHLGPLHNAGRICGSPVFGRAWSTSGYSSGGFHNGYASFYSDEDLWHRAMKLGVLWLDKETMHFHNHWSFGRAQRQSYHEAAQKNWQADQELFLKRQKEGFPA